MKLSTKNAYNSSARNNNSALSILIACDYHFFKDRYYLYHINDKINHKAYIKAIAVNDSKTVNQFINI